ncbi:DNA-binding protein [Malaciobacter marinus]|uniref:ORF6N domain-containing protein n=1 Tax=Malaciobacter marinus TaxID=505249 RepID=UPI000C084807|nr:ORF6N domain-containing protein [Malaciobacter marinus]PHO13167.1 DNA-binding protein [Malaciobacter marinus]
MENLPTNFIENKIYEIRGLKVMLDSDLASLYEVETKVLNQAVKRNIDRFPHDFMFQLTKEELEVLRSQFVTTKFSKTRAMPYAFTEQGVYMLATVLKSKVATEVTINIMRTFTKLREFALTYKDIYFIKNRIRTDSSNEIISLSKIEKIKKLNNRRL